MIHHQEVHVTTGGGAITVVPYFFPSETSFHVGSLGRGGGDVVGRSVIVFVLLGSNVLYGLKRYICVF